MTTPQDIAAAVMHYMADYDYYELDVDKASIITALVIAAIYQRTGEDIGVIRAGRYGAINSKAYHFIKPKDGKDIEEHFSSFEARQFENWEVAYVFSRVAALYTLYSPQQIIAISRFDDEHKRQQATADEMDKGKMLFTLTNTIETEKS